MHVLQRGKASMPLLRKTQATKLFLVFAALLLCLMAVSLLTGAGTAHAASVNSKSASVKPATSGGGCNSDGTVKSCISENSTFYIVPDAYILVSNVCSVEIDMYEYSMDNMVSSRNYGSTCYPAGTHLYGGAYGASSGHTWFSLVVALHGGYESLVTSPPLYT